MHSYNYTCTRVYSDQRIFVLPSTVSHIIFFIEFKWTDTYRSHTDYVTQYFKYYCYMQVTRFKQTYITTWIHYTWLHFLAIWSKYFSCNALHYTLYIFIKYFSYTVPYRRRNGIMAVVAKLLLWQGSEVYVVTGLTVRKKGESRERRPKLEFSKFPTFFGRVAPAFSSNR